MAGTTTEVIPSGMIQGSYIKMGAYGAVIGDCVDVGYTDKVEIAHKLTRNNIMVDQSLMPIDAPATEESIVLKFTMKQAALSKMVIAMGYPDSALVAGKISFGNGPSGYKTVFFVPAGPNGGTRTYHFFKVVAIGTTPAYERAKEVVLDVELTVIADMTKTAGAQAGEVYDSSGDTTPPTIAMTTPASAGSRTNGTKDTVLLTITEAGEMDEGSISYGASVCIFKQGTPNTLVAGTISYSSSAKTITFTPTSNWDEGTYQVVVSTELRDAALNNLAAPFLGYFTVSA